MGPFFKIVNNIGLCNMGSFLKTRKYGSKQYGFISEYWTHIGLSKYGLKNYLWVGVKKSCRGETPAGVGVKSFWRGLTPAGGGVTKISRGKTPAGVGVRIFCRGETPAGVRGKNFSRGQPPSGLGRQHFEGFRPWG